ncbi:cation:proton antiporter [Ferrimonas balearica]|uniref:cation:proton antiporter domain-containing protein n=1 Tax=Ferrimonas balearica TaxID=44012 RepID=UPI001C99D6CF|nr:cation:proton antiporter [Ferrimonas balearica]
MAVLATVVALCRPLDSAVRYPLLLILGTVAGQSVSLMGWESGWDAQGLTQVILYLFLPILVWEMAARLPLRRLARYRLNILLQSLLTLSLMLAGTTYALFKGLDHPGFPLLSALLAATLLATVDPAFGEPWVKQYPRVNAWLEGEAAVVEPLTLALLLTLVSVGELGSVSLPVLVLTLVKLLAMALLVGWVGAQVWRLSGGAQWGVLGTGLWLWWLFLLSELVLGIPGLVVVLTAVFWVRSRWQHTLPCRRLSPFLGDALVVILGFSLTAAMFTERYWAMGLGIASAALIRLGSLLPWLLWPGLPIKPGERSIWLLAPSRGPITLALVLALPTHLPAWWTVQSLAYGVILFDVLVQGTLLALRSRR